jgi:osmotically-inducible protein OsmY
MNDKQLRQDILDVFQWEPRIDAGHIAVVVERGFVTLTGRVESDDEKIAAEHVARHVDGVRDVVLSIEVRAPDSQPTENSKSDPTLDTD